MESRYQIDEDFADEIDKLGVDTSWSKRIRVGSTSEVLQSIGVKDQSIYWDGRKIQKILDKHSEKNFRAGVDNSVVTKEIIKQVPQVLENPIIVLHSDANRNADYASRIYMFGEVYDATGKPLDVSLELLPTNRKGVEIDSIVITSAYGKKNVQGLLNRDQILYIDKNKKRTDTWLAVNRLQLPLRITRYGSIASLHYAEGDVKSVTVDESRYQLDVDEEDVAAAREKSVGDGGTETQIIQTAMETAQASDVSHESLAGLAKRLIKRTASRADTQTITNRLAAINSYLKGGEVDYAVAHSIMLDVAQQVMEKSAKRNDELWKQYPELHKMSMQIEKGSSDYEGVVDATGSGQHVWVTLIAVQRCGCTPMPTRRASVVRAKRCALSCGKLKNILEKV